MRSALPSYRTSNRESVARNNPHIFGVSRSSCGNKCRGLLLKLALAAISIRREIIANDHPPNPASSHASGSRRCTDTHPLRLAAGKSYPRTSAPRELAKLRRGPPSSRRGKRPLEHNTREAVGANCSSAAIRRRCSNLKVRLRFCRHRRKHTRSLGSQTKQALPLVATAASLGTAVRRSGQACRAARRCGCAHQHTTQGSKTHPASPHQQRRFGRHHQISRRADRSFRLHGAAHAPHAVGGFGFAGHGRLSRSWAPSALRFLLSCPGCGSRRGRHFRPPLVNLASPLSTTRG